jgi:hypothetical protein
MGAKVCGISPYMFGVLGECKVGPDEKVVEVLSAERDM